MSLLRALFLRPIRCKEMLRYVVWDLDCIVLCAVFKSTDYEPNIVVCAAMFYDFVDCVFWRSNTMFSSFCFSCI